jgi:uncharacterized membrane protein (TIGR02234 family)
VAVRGADLAHIPVVTLVGSARHYWGTVVAVLAAVCSLIAAVLLMRSASTSGSDRLGAKYAAPATRRSIALREDANGAMLDEPETPEMSERMIWDALDEGRDPTDRSSESDTEGR